MLLQVFWRALSWETGDLSCKSLLVLLVNCVLWAYLQNSGCIFYYCSLINNKDISRKQQTTPWNVKCMYKFFNLIMEFFLKKGTHNNLLGSRRLFTLPVRISPLNYKQLSAHSKSVNIKSRNPMDGLVPVFSQWCKLLCQYQPGCTG